MNFAFQLKDAVRSACRSRTGRAKVGSQVIYYRGLIDRRKFLLTPLSLACAADATPNLVLITPSGWRGQAVPWDGAPDLTAPNLEDFGKQSVVFSRTYCASPKPYLAETALLNSEYPHAAKVGDAPLRELKRCTPEEAIQAFEKTPFAIQVTFLDPPSLHPPNEARVHPRGNVPPGVETVARRALSRFYGHCNAIDESIGRILAALDTRKLANDTIVVFTSDCGQQLGSHRIEGGGIFFEESVRIPLAIRYPRKLKPDARELATQVDIMPTIFALCGTEIPEGVQGVDLFGKTPPEVGFSEGKLGEADEWRMMVRGFDKVVATPKGEVTHLFNLADDPFELTNLVHDSAQKLTLASLKAQLLAQMKKLGDGLDPSGLRIR
jgi:arylsulfatase A-like enzyme